MKLTRFLPFAALSLLPGSLWAAPQTITSPDGSIVVNFDLVDGTPTYSVDRNGDALVAKSAHEVYLDGAKEGLDFTSTSNVELNSFNETWKPTWGQVSEIVNSYNEAVITASGDDVPDTNFHVRVFDNGVALRYSLDTGGKKAHDSVFMTFTGDHTLWAANQEEENIGPVKLSEWKVGDSLQVPITLDAGKHFAAVLEAAIYHQYPFAFTRVDGMTYKTTTKPSSWPENKAVSSWRVLSLGDSAGDLVTSNILPNLNPENQIEDTSWIKTGYTLWDWRSWGATAPDGFVYDLDMESWRRFIDFAAKHEHVKYLMIDANWYGPEFDPKMDPKKSRDHLLEQLEDGHIVRKPAPADWEEPIDMPALIKYGNERGVGIILYINDAARINYDFEETLATYQKWGAAGIKYGFKETKGDLKVEETRAIVEACARHNLIVDFHDKPIPGSGDSRTYPNYLTREFCHAQSDAKRSFSPSHFVTTVYNNMLTGSLDMANGLYAIKDAEKVRPRIFEKVNTTVVAETARTLINYAALSILPDIPEAYEAKADLFKFISSMPMNWDESHVLSGKIGHHITMARRAGDTWWIGSAIDEEGGEMEIDLSFLPEGSEWKATIYSDAADTHFETNPETYEITSREVKSGDKIAAKLAPGGGHCIMLEKK